MNSNFVVRVKNYLYPSPEDGAESARDPNAGRAGVLAIVSGTLTIAVLSLAIYSGYQSYHNDLLRDEERLVHEAELLADQFQKFASDAQILAEIIADSKDAVVPGGAVEHQLLAFVRERKVYNQARLLGPGGLEVVRINAGRAGPVRVPRANLQSKRDRDYFRETIRMRSGVRVSAIDWNQEYGRIEYPLAPVLRFSAPVRRGERVLGVVVLNYDAKLLRTRLDELQRTLVGRLYLINGAGRILLHDPGTFDFVDAEHAVVLNRTKWPDRIADGVYRISTDAGSGLCAPVPLAALLPESWLQTESWKLVFFRSGFVWSTPAVVSAGLGLIALLVTVRLTMRWSRAVRLREIRQHTAREAATRLAEWSRELEAANAALRRLEWRSRLLRQITSEANGAPDHEGSYRRVLKIVRAEFDFPFGHVYVRDPERDVLIFSGIYQYDDPASDGDFLEWIQHTEFTTGVGLPGEVWQENRAAWRSPFNDSDSDSDADPRAARLAEGNVHSAFAFPVAAHGNVEAVMEFFAREVREPNVDLTELTSEIGEELCYAVLRKKMQATLRDSEQILHETQAIARLGNWEYFPDTGKTRWSPRTFDILGYAADAREPDFQANLETIHPDDREVLLSHFETLVSEGRPYDILIRHTRVNDGQIIWVNIHGRAVYDNGKIQKFRGSIQDVTPLKSAEEELRAATLLAEEASRAKGDFLANMSHEIRTPLNAILGMAYLALKTDLDVRQRDYIEKIHMSGTTLLGLINDVLDFSKIEARKMELERTEFRLSEVLTNISNMLALKAQQKKIELAFFSDPDVPDQLIGDPLRLGQVLVNLMGNALKFTNRGSVIVFVSTVKQEHERIILQISVEDTGIGMRESEIERLFQPFSQADASTTRRFGGTGLGLAISSQIVQLMGGELKVFSVPGAGSSFIFTAAFELPRRVKPRYFPPNLVGLRALVVDDSLAARELLSNMLRSFTCSVDVADCGESALELIIKEGAEKYDLLLIDWKMPGEDGLSIARKIKKELGDAAPVIIVITVYSAEQINLPSSSEQSEIDGFLIKPVQQSVLFETILHCFGVGSHETETPADARPAETHASLRGARVLLVEDNELNLQVASEIISSAGVELTVARDGQQALDCVASEPPFDAVLMDIQMPVLDGYAATGGLRESAAGADLPIIAMTATAMNDDVARAFEVGMDAHIAKPIDPDRLLYVLAEFVRYGRRAGVRMKDSAVVVSAVEAQDSRVPGIHLSDALRRLQGNRKKMNSFLIQFAETYIGHDDKIKAAIESGDFETAASLAHALSGVAANLSIESVARAAQNLDLALRSGELQVAADVGETARSLIAELKTALIEALGSIEHMELERENQEDFPVRDGESLAGLDLERLKAFVRDFDTASLTELQQLRPDFARRGRSVEYARLHRCLSANDFEAAARLLERYQS